MLFKLFIRKVIEMILLQIAATDATLMHQYIIIGMIAFCIAIFSSTFIALMRTLKKKNVEIKLMQQQHVAKVDAVRKEHSDTLEKIRLEMLKREEERTRQWMESEKETLHVLNGVSTLLDLSEKIGRVESEKILKVLDTIYADVKRVNDFSFTLEALSIIKEKVEILTVVKEKVEKLEIINEKIGVLDVIKEKIGVLDVIKEKIGALDVIKEKIGVLDVIKEKVGVLDVIKEKIEKLSSPE